MLTLPLSAQPSSSDVASKTVAAAIEMDAFPVVGTRLPDAQLDRSPAVVVLDHDYIARSGATDLSDLLARLPQTYAGAGSGIATVPNGMPDYGNAQALFSFATGASAALQQTGVSSVGLRGLGAGGTLVLVDGRRLPLATQEDTANDTGSGFYDLSSVPLALVERVEVLANGASAVHGSDAVGGVINIVLRSDYSGGELVTGIRATEHGGGSERHATFSGGITRDRLRVFVSATTRDRAALRANQREFSAHQDATDRGGRDNRLLFGSPGVVSALSGNIAGVTTPDGTPARYAIVPAGTNGTGLNANDFVGAEGFSASGIQRFDTAEWKDLIGALEQTAVNADALYRLNDRVSGFLRLTWSDRTSITANEPPVTSGGGFGGTASYLPTESPYNPFGQVVAVSLVHVEAPPREQTVEVTSTRATAGLRGAWGESWQWEAAATYGNENFASNTLELRAPLFVAALADGRFNPFADPATHGPINADLYAELMTPASIVGMSRITGFDANARGRLFALPGGDVRLAIGAETLRARRQRTSTEPVFGQPASVATTRATHAAFAELWTPLIASAQDIPGLHHLAVRTAARYERTDAFAEATPAAGVQWEPLPAVRLFFDYAEGFRAPALTELEDQQIIRSRTISDPQLGGAAYAVSVIEGGNPDLAAEHSQTYQAGLTLTPPQVPGLTLRALGSETYYTRKLNTLNAQTFVSFESRFPTRVSRDASGQITEIDARTVNFGKVYVSSVDLGITYEQTFPAIGRFAWQLDATRQLEFRTELDPSRAAATTLDGTDTASPPKWSAAGSVSWSKGSWDVIVLAQYLSGYASNTTGALLDAATAYPSWTTLDLRIGYTFHDGLWRTWGRGARLQFGVGNIADRMPPFANTIYGYNPALHSPLGRTYDLTLHLPF